MRVSAEARFITRCVREPEDLQPRELQQIARTVEDWQVVAELAGRHGVAGFVRQAISRDDVAVPPFVAEGLRATALSQVTHVARLDSALSKILPALQQASVPTIVLKGPVLSRLVYPDQTLRPYSDLDLNVREPDEHTVSETLVKTGLVEVPHGAEVERLTHAHHVHGGGAFHRVFLAPGGGVMVELHLDPLQMGLRPTLEAARWERAQPMPDLPGALMLGAILSAEAVGLWSAAMRVVAIPVFVPTLIVTPLMPALSQIADRREAFVSTLRRAFELTLIVTMGASAVIFAFAPVVPSILGWAPEYQATVPLMQVLVCFFPLLSMGMVLGAAQVALGQERRLLLANIGATVVQYGLAILLVPVTASWLGNGTIGAALGRVFSEVVMLVAAQFILPRGVVTLGMWLFAVRVLLAGALLVVVVTALLPIVGWLWPLAGLAGGLAYLVALFLLRTIRPSDVRLGVDWLTARLRRG